MASPPRLKSIAREATPDAPAWWDRVLTLLSPFVGDVSSALNRGLTRRENMRSNYREGVEFTTKGTVTDTWPVLVKNDLETRPYACWLADLERVDGAAHAAAFSMSWKLNQTGQFELTFQGLSASTKYRATIIYE